jgi:glutaredoxin 3
LPVKHRRIIVKQVEIYTTRSCGFCIIAKRMLDSKGVAYVEHDLWSDMRLRDEMEKRSNGGRTVPQIFIDGKPVGGFNEMYELNRSGRLDVLLAG